MSRSRRFLAACLASSISFAGFCQSAQAGGLITAEQVVVRSAPSATVLDVRAQLLAVLDRSDVAAALVERGVNVDQARERVAALTDAEAAQLLADIDHAPAGANEFIGTAVLIFVALVFSDILGFTRIFPFLRKAR
ncbi:MAG: PA2779 family protein [Rhizobacter sp.]